MKLVLKSLEKDKCLALLSKAIGSSLNAIGMTDLEGILIYVNESAVKLWGYDDKQEMLGRYLPELWEGDRIFKSLEELHCNGYSVGEDIGKRKDGSLFNVEYRANIIRDDFGEPLAMFGCCLDITERKIAQRESNKKHQELESKSQELEEVNAALKVLLKKREKDKIEIEERVLLNVQTIVEPYFEKLQQSKLNERQKTYLEIIQTNLNDIISPFARNFSSIYYRLTPQEVQIADLIKQGKINKEIAQIMGLSQKTIEFHRTNIRKKLRLTNRKANLRTYLMSYS
jgi:PAS domain S-box-containing protein